MNSELNIRQQKFVELVFLGNPAGRAYKEAGYNVSDKVANASASRLLLNDNIKEHLNKMREEASKGVLLDQKGKLDMLHRIAVKMEHIDPRVAITAIAEENKMTGGYEPERIQCEFEVVIGGE